MRKLWALFLRQLINRNAPNSTQSWYQDLLTDWFDTGAITVDESTVSVKEFNNGVAKKLVITCTDTPVTLVKNGTTSGGGGTKLCTLPEGLILPKAGSTNLTIAAAGDKSFLASIGSAAADTGGTLSGTEITFLPSTAVTTTRGAGTCKMKSTAVAPVVGVPVDGTGTPVPVYLNACLNADATGVEDLTFSGTITLNWEHAGDY